MIPIMVYYRNHGVIKAASFDFLIIILIGLIFNFIYSILEMEEISSDLFCINILFIENLGFTLTYGSIISKTVRVYHVFTQKAVIQKNNYSKYVFLAVLLFVNIMVTLKHYLTKTVKRNVLLTDDGMEYHVCEYSKDEDLM